MCAPCRVRCCTLRTGCCRPPLEKLRPVDNYKWFQHCEEHDCRNCKKNSTDEDDGYTSDCDCICRRNRHIIEALSCLFKCSVQYMVSLLFKLAYQQVQPLQRFPRDRVWDVMEHVKAPYTELNDLEIYDSMYDRCGQPIDPLDADNINKIVRLMFLREVLTSDQRKYLMRLLRQLNEHAFCPVHLDLLLQTLQTIDLNKLVCGIRHQEQLSRRLYTGRQCQSICQLYNKVSTVDKRMVAQNRKKRRRKLKMSGTDAQTEEMNIARQSVLNRQFCERKPADNVSDVTPPRSTIHRASGSKRYSSTISKRPSKRNRQSALKM
ncbi:uncharacterized protein LOC6583849 [Drosophila mojavensis]|uniref:Uncharacterized protein n=1 Tax=Drosophila mojavensis TaxID=7230 RepID=B4L2F2_DROMO|nr:uncharacterized protein LOC6583849 [Drosophila mojavensis]EDW06828.1 uncharacterized protein Dmoj_GI15394 [Drosophila mojavensis]